MVSALLIFLPFHGPSMINWWDSYLYMGYAQSVNTYGFSSLGNGVIIAGPLPTRYLLILGIALMYDVLGPGIPAATMFEFLCVAATIAAIYVIGMKLTGKHEALLAASLYSFFPIVIIEAGNIGNDVPMAMFATVSIMLFVLASKNKNNTYYLLSAAIAILGFSVVAESILILLPIIIIGAYLIIKEGISRYTLPIAYFSVGIVVGVVATIILSYLATGNPLYSFASNASMYVSNAAPPIHSLLGSMKYYILTMMPYAPMSNGIPVVTPGYVSFLNGFIVPHYISKVADTRADFFLYGYFFYAAITAAAYLLIKRESSAMVPMVWFVSLLLYILFGALGPTSAIGTLPFTKYTLIFAPAIVLIISFGISEAYGSIKKHSVELARAFVIAVVLVLFLESAFLVAYLGNEIAISPITAFIRGIGSYLNTLPENSTISVPGAFQLLLQPYTNYKQLVYEQPLNASELESMQSPPEYAILPYAGNESILQYAVSVYTPNVPNANYASVLYSNYNFFAYEQNISVYRLKSR